MPGRLSLLTPNGIEYDVYFADPANTAPAFVSVIIDIDLETDALSQIKYDRRWKRFIRKHGDLTTQVTPIIGRPDFVGGLDEPGAPSGITGHRFAVWNLGKSQVITRVTHEGPETPIELSVLIRPRN
jgi:hypothetical protein